jgi:hypothetical protein
LHGARGTDGSDLSVFEQDDAIFDGAVGNREDFAAAEGDGFLLGCPSPKLQLALKSAR